MNWSKIKCAVFGHKWSTPCWMSGPRECLSCWVLGEGVQHRPPPPMPPCKPPRVDLDRMAVAQISLANGDAIVVSHPDRLNSEQRAALVQHIRAGLGFDGKVIIIDGGVRLDIVHRQRDDS